MQSVDVKCECGLATSVVAWLPLLQATVARRLNMGMTGHGESEKSRGTASPLETMPSNTEEANGRPRQRQHAAGIGESRWQAYTSSTRTER
jgi:hypothetical protein